MMLLALDFETTWELDTTKTKITEIGAVLYEWEMKKPIEIFSQLVWLPDYPVSPLELVALTGITDEMLRERGWPPLNALQNLTQIMRDADYVVAHNGNQFDKPVYYNQCCQNQVQADEDAQWIDTSIDVPYPEHIKTRKLSHLAADHGFANPFSHRAVFDCLTMLKVLEFYDIEEVIKLSQEPTIKCVAQVHYKEREKAKQRGYYWDGDLKIWFKKLKKSHYEKEAKEAPFIVNAVEEI